MSKFLAALFATVQLSLLAADADKPHEPIQPFKIWKDVKECELKPFTAAKPTRHELSNGMVVFLMEDHELPIVDLSMTIRAGNIHDPAELTGISDVAMSVMRSGGSKNYPGDKLDELLENMGAELSLYSGSDSGGVSLKTLKDDFPKGLEILADVLREPDFPEEKIALQLAQMRAGIARRNDQPGAIAGREFRRALYGAGNPYARVIEYENLARIDRAALRAYHASVIHPNAIILGVVGDFKSEDLLAKLKSTFEPWPKGELKLSAVATIPTAHERKLLFVERPKIPQTTVIMGHVVDLRRNSPDYAAVQMMNEILAGGMSARMFTEVRTRKGLAYSVSGSAQIYFDRPGLFYATALTRNEQALETVEAIREEIVKLKEKGVTENELAEARQSILNSFIFNFDSASKILTRQMTYELYAYPPDFAEKLLERIKQVTVADVNRVAAQYLDVDNMSVLGVGNSAQVDPKKSIRELPGVKLVDIAIPPPPKASK